ncbi:PREDICTED: proteinase-activated receptor 1-like [Cyprinodon variegatus]|uniref:Proteinase-activated receptor 1 n=1 Tax=Cyprinodon variegatus TaxID=28743 RepID=A0A3Q2CYS2_CYPVA|nr:PREDICTED: proteinase-activated receptor 1-like [Cyprinodon variegatus]
MFSLEIKSAFWVLVYLLSAAAALPSKSNATGPRTFILGPGPFTDEPIPLPTDYIDGDGKPDLPQNRTVQNRTELRLYLSEEAFQFLTGPVSTLIMPSFYTLVCCISVPINLCAVLAFARGICPKKPAAIYMLNLACADLLFGLMLPFKIIYHFWGNNWIFGPYLCQVVTASFYWNMYCSVLLIACISVDRFLAVVYPIESLTWRKPKSAIIACVTMWVLSFAASVPLVTSDQTAYLPQLNIITCHDVQHFGRIFWLKMYFIAVFFSLFFLPFIVTVGSYTKVIWTLSRVPHGLTGSIRKKTRAVMMALTVLVIFVLCFMPTNCLLLAHYFMLNKELKDVSEAQDGFYGLYLMFLCLGSLNCLLDPLAYYFGSSQCQRQLSNMLKCGKLKRSGSITHASSDSCRSSIRPILKSSCTESSKITSSISKTSSLEANLDSQYKKLLV